MVPVMADKYIMASISMIYRLEFYGKEEPSLFPVYYLNFSVSVDLTQSQFMQWVPICYCPALVYSDARIGAAGALLAGFVSLQYAPMFSGTS